MTVSRLLLSRARLEDFLACQRRFALNLGLPRRLPWPPAPLAEQAEEGLTRGQAFHQLLERHFLGLPVTPELVGDEQVRRWWGAFLRSGLRLPAGRPLPELSLTVPVAGHLLYGRFDLLILGNEDGHPTAHLFDWKTGKARHEADLRQEWQTRLYLAMLAEGGRALTTDGRVISPEHISLTYWYASQPESPRIIHYTAAWHAQNWAEITLLVTHIQAALTLGEWPLTDDLNHCRACSYQSYCGRQQAGQASFAPPEEPEENEADWLLEPETAWG